MLESGCGRRYGWFIEREGQRVGILSDPTFADCFWVRYRITPLSDSKEALGLLFEDDYWVSPKYRFINREFSGYYVHAFGPVDSDRHHVIMRGLHLNVEFSTYERIVGWHRIRRAFRKSNCDPINLEPNVACDDLID
jgi:hypothetical protein